MRVVPRYVGSFERRRRFSGAAALDTLLRIVRLLTSKKYARVALAHGTWHTVGHTPHNSEDRGSKAVANKGLRGSR